jgi:UDP-N-acetylglucosamine--N-acetylmuramyl-(pentapeptide) pyrophosphoryl-undecaprenol N-acetylglucosamine transferase
VKAIIAGGGTGGHLFPAIALAEELRSRLPDLSLLFVGAQGGVEASLLAKRGWEFEEIRTSGLKGKALSQRLRGLALIPSSLIRSRSILRRFRPDVVVGFGGYASASIVRAGAVAGIPTVIHEQNAFPGLTNRWLGMIVDHVAVAFEGVSGFFPKGKVRVTGNPIRTELFGVDRAEAMARFDFDPHRLTVLIFGGSQGAHRLNQAVLEALPLLESDRGQVQFLHATGPRDLGPVRQGYITGGHRAVVESFFWEMAVAYAAADLCLCRAGATTAAELCALGKPAILVPFPFAANDHQRWNAEALVATGGARMVQDRGLNGEAVAGIVKAFLRDRDGLHAMAGKVKSLARPDAAARLADLVVLAARQVPGAKFRVDNPEGGSVKWNLKLGTWNCEEHV